jgi:excisionase family DNA binding protein
MNEAVLAHPAHASAPSDCVPLHETSGPVVAAEPFSPLGEAASDAPLPSSVDPLPPVLTIEELAAFLRVNHKTVRQAIVRGEIPGVRRVGGVIRIYREAVISWFTSNQDRVSRSRRSR